MLADATPQGADPRAAFQQDLWHYTLAKMVDACAAAGIKPFYGPFGDFSDPEACEAQFRNAFLMGCVGAWTLHPSQVPIAKRVFSPDPAEVAFANKISHAMPDGSGAVMIDGKMQDDATWKQAKVLSTSPAWSPPRTRSWRRATSLIHASARWRGPQSWIISASSMSKTRSAKFKIGQVVRHRLFPFRGVVFDIDPEFNNTEEWYQSIPAEVRPHKDQPFYHLFAENAETEYIAYVSEQNLLPDTSGEPVRHPQVAEVFEQDEKGSYRPRNSLN